MRSSLPFFWAKHPDVCSFFDALCDAQLGIVHTSVLLVFPLFCLAVWAYGLGVAVSVSLLACVCVCAGGGRGGGGFAHARAASRARVRAASTPCRRPFLAASTRHSPDPAARAWPTASAIEGQGAREPGDRGDNDTHSKKNSRGTLRRKMQRGERFAILFAKVRAVRSLAVPVRLARLLRTQGSWSQARRTLLAHCHASPATPRPAPAERCAVRKRRARPHLEHWPSGPSQGTLCDTLFSAPSAPLRRRHLGPAPARQRCRRSTHAGPAASHMTWHEFLGGAPAGRGLAGPWRRGNAAAHVRSSSQTCRACGIG